MQQANEDVGSQSRPRLVGQILLTLVPLAALCAANNQPPSKLVSIGSLPPGWQVALLKYGDRMQRPGKERLTLSGTLTRNGSTTTPFQLVHELPNLTHYQEGATGAATTLAFDGNKFSKTNGGVQTPDADLIETLVYDSPVWFLYAPSTGMPTRKLGSRFQVDPQPGKPYTGPLYDVYQILVPVQKPGRVKSQPKFYHVNSNTQLIENVNYQDADNPSSRIQIVLGNWTTVSGNSVPQTIRRLENGVEVLRFTVTSAVFGPSVADGLFLIP